MRQAHNVPTLQNNQKSLENLSSMHADLCMAIDFEQLPDLVPEKESPHNHLYMDNRWLFADKSKCFEEYVTLKILQNTIDPGGGGGPLADFTLSTPNGHMETIIFLVAAVQFAACVENPRPFDVGSLSLSTFKESLRNNLSVINFDETMETHYCRCACRPGIS